MLAAERALAGFTGDVLILCGDVPLVRAEALTSFVKEVGAKQASLGILTMQPADADAYAIFLRGRLQEAGL